MMAVFFISFCLTARSQNTLPKADWTICQVNDEIAKYKDPATKADYEEIVKSGGFVDAALKFAENDKVKSDGMGKLVLQVELILSMCSNPDERINSFNKRVVMLNEIMDSDILYKDVVSRFEIYTRKTPDYLLAEATIQQLSKDLKTQKDSETYKKAIVILAQEENCEFLDKYENDFSKQYPDVFKIIKNQINNQKNKKIEEVPIGG